MTTFGILSKQGILTWKYKEGEESDLVYPTQAKKKEVFSNIKKPIGLNCHARHALNCGTLSLKIPKRENEAESILCPFAQFSKCDSIIILKKTHVVNYDPELFKMFFSVFGAKVAASFFAGNKSKPIPNPKIYFCNPWRPQCHILDHRHMSLKVPNIEFDLDVSVWHCLLSTHTLKLNSTLGTHLHAMITSF